jgi:hypothetical protein
MGKEPSPLSSHFLGYIELPTPHVLGLLVILEKVHCNQESNFLTVMSFHLTQAFSICVVWRSSIICAYTIAGLEPHMVQNYFKLVSHFTLCCSCQLNPPTNSSPSCRISSGVTIKMLLFHLYLVYGTLLICICVPFTISNLNLSELSRKIQISWIV